jgi:hypothetical protein
VPPSASTGPLKKWDAPSSARKAHAHEINEKTGRRAPFYYIAVLYPAINLKTHAWLRSKALIRAFFMSKFELSVALVCQVRGLRWTWMLETVKKIIKMAISIKNISA